MGMDVNLYVEVDVTPERLNKAEEFFTARSTMGDPWGDDPHVLIQRHHSWLERPRVEVRTLDRYYDVGYERGDWPSIYAAIRILQTLFPEGTVFYGSDSTDDGEECTDEFLAGLWDHFLSEHGTAYANRYRRPTDPNGAHQ